MTVCCVAPNGVNWVHSQSVATRLLVGALDGVHVFVRDELGAPWAKTGAALAGKHVSSMMYEPSSGGVFAGIHDGGLYYSGDAGENWERRTNGITEEHVFTVSYANAPEGTVLYAGTEPARLFRSTDYGNSWDELDSLRSMPGNEKWSFPPPPHLAHVKNVVVDPQNPRKVYAVIEQGALLVSEDGGDNWRELSDYAREDDFVYHDIHQVAIVPSNPAEFFMTAGTGLYHTTDAGETFERLTDTDFRAGYPDHIFISPLDESVIFVTGAKHSPFEWRESHTANGALMRSDDKGRTWTQLRDGLPSESRANFEAFSLAGHAGGISLFVGNTDGEVYTSEDGGETWSLLASGLKPISKGGHYLHLQAEQPSAHA